MTRRVLAVGPGSLGDVLLTGPAVRALARNAEVVYLCGPRGVPAASLLPGVARTELLAPAQVGSDEEASERLAIRRLVRRLRRLAFDEAFIFPSSDQSALPFAQLARAAGITRVAGTSIDGAEDLLDVSIPEPPDLHDVETNLLVASAFGSVLARDDDGLLQVREPDGAFPTVRSPYVVVHPGSAPSDTAPRVGWWRAVVKMADDAGLRVVVTGSHTEMELCAEVCAGRRDAMSVAGLTDFTWLVRLFGGAEAVLCGSVGPGHAAAAAGTPVVSVAAWSTPTKRCRPWGVRSLMLDGSRQGASPDAALRALSCTSLPVPPLRRARTGAPVPGPTPWRARDADPLPAPWPRWGQAISFPPVSPVSDGRC